MNFVNKIFILLSVILFLLSISACRKKGSYLSRNESIEYLLEKSQLQRQKMCLVLIDKNDTISKIYLKILESKHQELLQSAIFNVVDITNPENKWYKE